MVCVCVFKAPITLKVFDGNSSHWRDLEGRESVCGMLLMQRNSDSGGEARQDKKEYNDKAGDMITDQKCVTERTNADLQTHQANPYTRCVFGEWVTAWISRADGQARSNKNCIANSERRLRTSGQQVAMVTRHIRVRERM